MGWIGAATGARFSTISPPAPPPSEDPDFGPAGTGTLAQRVQAVKNSTIPQAVVHPGGSPTVVNPGDSISAKITTAGTNGTLWFTKGQHNVSGQLNPLSGQIWVLESAAGYSRSTLDSAVLDGNNGSLNGIVFSTNPNVTIRGGVFRNQGNSLSGTFAAAILHNGGVSAGGWLLEDIIIQDNFNKGFNLGGPNCTARRVYLTNNGRYGPNIAQGASGENYTGIVIENCRWSFNNSRQLDPGAAAGGSKFVHCPGLIVRNCWVHDNHGFGIWSDFVNNDIGEVLYANNVVEHNRRSGLFFEGVWGGCSAFRNYIYNNGYDANPIGPTTAHFTFNTQFRVTNSDSTLGSAVRGDITRNVFDFDLAQSSNLGRAMLLWNHNGEPDDVKAWDVHQNQFWLRTTDDQRVMGHDTKTDVGSSELWAGDNDFFDNEYHVASTGISYWRWGTGTEQGSAKTYSQWQSFHPGDNLALITL